ncbi:hypothetical protein QFC22_005148 [Naganishia vaughanmartiniae]|uniref:Uncharacterized protein n=1 Tax=Naganishia vaughanmartiniae TaxID=1424756 RepID=A0ACC2WV86_9TREE|nr:hypothetical protein QFC22_005148 [Naganishia vaughanmartiniae]
MFTEMLDALPRDYIDPNVDVLISDSPETSWSELKESMRRVVKVYCPYRVAGTERLYDLNYRSSNGGTTFCTIRPDGVLHPEYSLDLQYIDDVGHRGVRPSEPFFIDQGPNR